MSRIADPRFAAHLRALIADRGLSYRTLAASTFYGKSTLHDLAAGRKPPSPEAARRLDDALGAGGTLVALAGPPALGEDEADAIDLAARVSATDVSATTLTQLEDAFDDLATRYPTRPPAELIPDVRRYLMYVGHLFDGRKTLAQHRRLLVVGGWLSLLGATLHIDMRQPRPAAARLSSANRLAVEGEHPEIRAWCLETKAWDVLTEGDYPLAVKLSQEAQAIAPAGSSALIQATAQEGRAWARMHQIAQTRKALARVNKLAAPLAVPDRPEHHYRYDPDKALSYTATTLSWSGDPAAEEYARAVIVQLETSGTPRPRRAASARLDLGLALLATRKQDEATAAAIAAITSGRIVRSNWWRATEVLTVVESAGLPEARDLRDAYETHRP